MSDDADALRQRIAALAKASDPVAEQQEQDALLDARRRKEAALLYQKRLDAAQAAYALAERNAEDAERERTARTARTEAITASDAALANAIKVAGQSRISVEDAEAAVAACREAVSAAQACATNSRQRARHHRGMVEIVRRTATLAAHQAVLEQAASLQSRVNGLVARLEGMRIDKERIAAVRKAVRERDVTRLVLQAQATQIDFDLLPEVADRVLLGGIALTGGRKTLAVVEDAEIAIAGIGRFHVRPAIRDRQKLLKNALAAEEHLEAVLATSGTADPADAERQWSDRELLERDLRDARAELTRLVPGDPSSGLAPGIGALRDHIDVLRRRIEEECSALGVTDLPAMAEAIAEARIAEEAEITAGEALTEVRAELDIMSTRRTDAREALARAEAEANAARVALERLRRDAHDAEALEPNQALTARLERAEAQRAKRNAELAELERDRPLETPDGMQTRIERYEKALANRQHAIRQLREEIAGLRARITQEGGNGLDEQIAAAERQHDALAQEEAACARETRILRLLLDALVAAERETKERYLAPVIRRVTPYLRTLFPGADISCDDTLRITGLTREPLGSEEFDRLSDGTQEQVAVLARLAFAEMLTDQGKPAMVILDDALAYSDGERIERMFDILAQASAKTQILVLTCREDLFARLGGHRIELKASESVLSA
jgi:hypothetical protein